MEQPPEEYGHGHANEPDDTLIIPGAPSGPPPPLPTVPPARPTGAYGSYFDQDEQDTADRINALRDDDEQQFGYLR